MLLGNQLRRWLRDGLDNRRVAIASTNLDTPHYQAELNCMEADLLQAIAGTIQDHIERMTNEMELERQRKRMEGTDFDNA